jgi:hypothetical protein
LIEYEIDQTVGGEPQIWFIPNTSAGWYGIDINL